MIVRWTPWQDLNRLQREMNTLFENRAAATTNAPNEAPMCDWLPAVDVYEDTERYVVTAELPGFDPKQVDVKVEDNRLTLRGERKLEREEKKENYHRVERAYGTFTRTFTLPTTVDVTKITAEYKHGLLHVSIPKKPEVTPKQVTVKVTE